MNAYTAKKTLRLFLALFIQTNSFRLSFSLNIHERSIVIRGVQKRETNQIFSYLPPAKLKTVELTICGNKGKEKEDNGGKNSCQLTRSPPFTHSTAM